jgi:hypothetical protein
MDLQKVMSKKQGEKIFLLVSKRSLTKRAGSVTKYHGFGTLGENMEDGEDPWIYLLMLLLLDIPES